MGASNRGIGFQSVTIGNLNVDVGEPEEHSRKRLKQQTGRKAKASGETSSVKITGRSKFSMMQHRMTVDNETYPTSQPRPSRLFGGRHQSLDIARGNLLAREIPLEAPLPSRSGPAVRG